MTDSHNDERPGCQPEPFLNTSTNNVVDFATAGAHRKALAEPDARGEPDGLSECRMLESLRFRFARFNTGLYPLDGDKLLLSQAGGFTRVLPDLRAAHYVVRQLEGRS